MEHERTYLLSNLAAGMFIDLAVPAEDDVMVAAKAHLQHTGLSSEVQQGFFISLYPIAQGADSAADIPGSPGASPAHQPAAAAHENASPLDAAAARGPMDWNDDDLEGSADADDRRSTAEESPVIAFPLGSAGGH